MRMKRRWVTGSRRWAMHASKSSSKQASALGGWSTESARTPAASWRAIARDGAR